MFTLMDRAFELGVQDSEGRKLEHKDLEVLLVEFAVRDFATKQWEPNYRKPTLFLVVPKGFVEKEKFSIGADPHDYQTLNVRLKETMGGVYDRYNGYSIKIEPESYMESTGKWDLSGYVEHWDEDGMTSAGGMGAVAFDNEGKLRNYWPEGNTVLFFVGCRGVKENVQWPCVPLDHNLLVANT
jgi:hypothetical protein